MTLWLAAASMAVGGAALFSALLYLPALAVAETISPRRPASRAAVWFAALCLPPLLGLLAAGTGLALTRVAPLYSPHAGAPRTHLCLRPLFEGPDAQWRAQIVAVLAGVLLVAALLRLAFGAASSLQLRAMVRLMGRAVPDDWGQGDLPLYLLPTEDQGVVCVGLWRPVIALDARAAEQYDDAQLRSALAHEVAHARRRDNLSDLLAAACVTLISFMPTAYLFRRYWRREAELACDQAAARATSPEAVASALSAQIGSAGAGAPSDAAARQVGARLDTLQEGLTGRSGRETRLITWIFAVIAVLCLGLAVAVTSPQLRDSLQCAAQTLTHALSGA